MRKTREILRLRWPQDRSFREIAKALLRSTPIAVGDSSGNRAWTRGLTILSGNELVGRSTDKHGEINCRCRLRGWACEMARASTKQLELKCDKNGPPRERAPREAARLVGVRAGACRDARACRRRVATHVRGISRDQGTGGRKLIVASGYDGSMVWWPKTWLLSEGWRKRGLISTEFVPSGDE